MIIIPIEENDCKPNDSDTNDKNKVHKQFLKVI